MYWNSIPARPNYAKKLKIQPFEVKFSEDQENIVQRPHASTTVGMDAISGSGWRAITDRNASVSTSYLLKLRPFIIEINSLNNNSKTQWNIARNMFLR